MDFASLERFLAESGVYRRVDGMIAFITYREVRELRLERADVRRVPVKEERTR